MAARDPRFDGRFFTAVTSTGIYCLPVCPARTPARAHMRFFPHAGAAEAAGFRACRAAPGGQPGLTGLERPGRPGRPGGAADRGRLRRRARDRRAGRPAGGHPAAPAPAAGGRAGGRAAGPGPDRAAADRAAAAGRDHDAGHRGRVRQRLLQRPAVQRQRAGVLRAHPVAAAGPGPAHRPGRPGRPGLRRAPGTWLTLRLACREPFDAAGWLAFLAARAIPGVEQVSADRYARTVATAAGPGIIELIPRPGQGHVLLRAQLTGLAAVARSSAAPGGCSTPTPTRPRSAPRWPPTPARPAGAGAARAAGARRLRRLRTGRPRGPRPAGLGRRGEHVRGPPGRPARPPAARRRFP